jgi:hypothetical protein
MISIVLGSVPDQPRCKEHDMPAHYALEVNDVQVALCPTCVRELESSLDEIKDPYGRNRIEKL